MATLDIVLRCFKEKVHSSYTLAAKTGFSPATMATAIIKLRDAGKIEVDHQLLTGGRPINVYRLAKPKVKTECRKAGPILFPQYRWGSTRLG